ncbi:unnamed protein product [Discula destructiva]
MLRPVSLRTATAASRGVVLATACQTSSFVNTTRFLTTASSETAEASIPPTTPASTPLQHTSTSSEALVSETRPAPIPRQLTYAVERTASDHLPVFDEVKSGGTRKYTVIRKVTGDAQSLKKDIIAELRFKKDDVNVNPVTGHVAVKGHHQARVKTWLEARGCAIVPKGSSGTLTPAEWRQHRTAHK